VFRLWAIDGQICQQHRTTSPVWGTAMRCRRQSVKSEFLPAADTEKKKATSRNRDLILMSEQTDGREGSEDLEYNHLRLTKRNAKRGGLKRTGQNQRPWCQLKLDRTRDLNRKTETGQNQRPETYSKRTHYCNIKAFI